MFIDASAIVAILGREPGHEEIEKRMAGVEGRFLVSPLMKFEASVALARQKAGKGKNVKPSPEILRQAQRAVDAFVEDLACAKLMGVPLIYKGKDFAHTDHARKRARGLI